MIGGFENLEKGGFGKLMRGWFGIVTIFEK